MSRPARHTPSSTELHRQWLALVDTDGPFLSVPTLKRVWPQGMPQINEDAKARLAQAKPAFERAWERWDATPDDDAAALDTYRTARDAWVETALRDVLGWSDSYARRAALAAWDDIVAGVRSPDHSVHVTPTAALTHGDSVGALVLVVDPVESLRDALDDGWAASPIDRMEELLRHTGVRIGVVTDGRWWAVVSARPGTMVASGIVDSQTWIEEPATRNAFVELLQRKRLIGGKESDRLSELFGESVAAAEEITDALGVQVRKAVELLVQAFSDAALEDRRRGEPDPLPAARSEVYEAAVTVMMRVVFLLFAEERGLLPQSSLFALGYGISTELDTLDTRRREEDEESLDATSLTWHRLLATSQALYQGASFEDMRLPAYGGSLFDAARAPFLTARSANGALAMAVSDRVMLEVLRSVQVTTIGSEARRISFREIDVEQIGYIYEGLLGYTSHEVSDVTLGLIGKAGEEPEIPLDVLEDLTEDETDDAAIADAILDWAKKNQPASTPPSRAALTKALRAGDSMEDAERAILTVATHDTELHDRLRGWIGIIRRDLRGRPLVIPPGGLAVVETPSRANSGAHYTPRSLAEEVVKYALEPLVYSPGPHDTPDGDQWRPLSSDKILDLKVADIACGSGAFLVAAARYLARHLVEAWHREGAATGAPHDLETHALRQVVASCLYGADINEMAVEMCKLSLWLVSLDPRLPFSFVDDKVLHGNSLLGLTDVRQLERQHIDPDAAPRRDSLFDLDVTGVLTEAANLRRRLATEIDNTDPQRSATTKRRQWREYQDLTAQLTHVADGVVAAGLRLGGRPGRALNDVYADLRVAVARAYPSLGETSDASMLDAIIKRGLTPTVNTDYKQWKPLHWILAVPDVMAAGGFHAVVGNPPYLGGKKLSGAIGTNVRDWCVNVLADRQKGSADLVAYFLLRAMSLLNRFGTLGLIATNTVAQGDTREVGLDQMVARGLTITRSVQSRSWPARSATLEYAAVWATRREVSKEVERVSDGVVVEGISTLLEPMGRLSAAPLRLAENIGGAYIGCYVLGLGFVLDPEEAAMWVKEEPRNAEVLFPYLNGLDLNSRPDSSASRWVIDFDDRSLAASQAFEKPFGRVQTAVLPERSLNARKAYRERFWQFAERRKGLRKALETKLEALVMAQVSNGVMPVRVPARQVFDQKLIVFNMETFADQGILSSSHHWLWGVKHSPTLGAGVSYSPSDAFLTFPRPAPTGALNEIGEALDLERRAIMLRRDLGLTKLYNLVNDPAIADSADRDVARLRRIHVELDQAVMGAYGWSDVPLDHGFHTYRQMVRWTVSPAARVEILDRLLEENHRRAAAQGDAPPSEAGDEEESE